MGGYSNSISKRYLWRHGKIIAGRTPYVRLRRIFLASLIHLR